jgi:ketosteroid isomerase-like protein
MAQEERNVAVVREGYRLWNESKGGSVDYWLSLLSPEINFESLGQGRVDSIAFTRTRRSRDEVARYLRELTREWTMEVKEFVAEGSRVVAIGRMSWRNKRTEKLVDSPKVDVWRFDDAGKATEFYEFYDTAALIEAVS